MSLGIISFVSEVGVRGEGGVHTVRSQLAIAFYPTKVDVYKWNSINSVSVNFRKLLQLSAAKTASWL